MDKAVASVHRCWGAEIALGATAFWEISHPEWLLAFPTGPASSVPHPMPYGENGQTSLCHPWSAGAAPWLTANVLGVTPLAPGFASVSVAPHITSQMAAAGGLRGSAPTPRGDVSINVDVAAASSVTVTAPAPARPHAPRARARAHTHIHTGTHRQTHTHTDTHTKTNTHL